MDALSALGGGVAFAVLRFGTCRSATPGSGTAPWNRRGCVSRGGGRERSERGFFQPRAQRAGFFGAIFQRVSSDFNITVDLLPPFSPVCHSGSRVQYLATSVTYSFSFVHNG